MRSLALPSFALAGFLAGCTDTGAHLTFSAPEGPTVAESFRVILATPEKVPSIQYQRIEPGSNATQTVSYYLQRSVAGASEDKVDNVDGFTMRIAPDSDFGDTQFIPFVLFYDKAGAITGVGTYRAGDTPTPSPILVVRDEIDKYTLDVEAVAQVDALDAPAPGQVVVVDCTRDDQSTFTSGVVWRPAGGGELRLVLPNDGGTDATGRELDLDCDDHVVKPDDSGPDCDDTRSKFYAGAEDVCDGMDTNCDGAQAISTSCTQPGGNTCVDPITMQPVPGVLTCDDRTGTPLGCHLPASCLCRAGTPGCVTCQMPWAVGNTTSAVKPCQPAIGTLSTYGSCSDIAPCTVELLSVTGGWKIELAATSSGPFGSRAYKVGASLVFRAKRPEGPAYEVPSIAAQAQELADINLAFVTPTSTVFAPVRLKLDEAISLGGCPAAPVMICTP